MNFGSIFIISLSIFFTIIPTRIHAQESIKESEQLDFAQGLLSRGMYDMAILQYQKFISNFPHSSSLQQAYLSLGEVYFLSQDFTKAVDAFNQFKQLFPNSDQLPMSLLRLGQIDIQQKKYDEALKQLTSIDPQKQLKGPMLQSFDYYTGQAYLGNNDNASALTFFQKATQVDGATDYTAYAFKEIGKIQSQGGHYAEALDAYSKSLPLAGDDALKSELSYRTAEVSFLQEKYDDAINGFGDVLSKYPNSDFVKDALANLLLAYFNLGQYDELIKKYQQNTQLIKADDSCYEIYFAAVIAFIELKQFDQANALLDRMLAFAALSPQERAKIFIKKSDILIRQKNYKDAMALLDAYSSQNNDNADENLFLKAQAFYGLGNYDQAFNFFENVYSNFPKSRFNMAALLGQAHARKQTGRFKESEALFMKYADGQGLPDLKSEALYDAFMMSVKAGDTSGIIAAAHEYLKAFPNGEQSADVLIALADTYGKNNQVQDAIDLLQGYLAKSDSVQRPNTANFLLGFNLQLKDKTDDALAAYAKVDQAKEGGKFYIAALKNIAIIYTNQKKFDQARTYFDQMIAQAGPNDLQIKTYIWLCNEYLKLQKFDDVLRVVAQAEKNFMPSDLIEIKYFKAEALRGQGNCDDAIKNYDMVTSSMSKNMYTGSSHIGRGLCLEKANKLDEAKDELQKSLDENGDDYTITVHAQFEIANLENSRGNSEEALKYYLLVATIYDDPYYCSESLLRAAKISEGLSRKSDAIKMYSEILDKYKNSTAAKFAQERIGSLK